MNINSEMNIEDLETLREQQAELAGAMGHHELYAVALGFPPGDKCIATPESLREGLAKGEIDICVSPMSQAEVALNKMFPNIEHKPSLKDSFAGPSGVADNAPSPADPSIIDFTRSA